MLTKEQLKERRSYLGGSDSAAVLGLSRWRTFWKRISSTPLTRLTLDERESDMSKENIEKCSREPYWNEMSDGQKIDILKQCVFSLQKKVVELSRTEGDFIRHSHSNSGSAVVEIRGASSFILETPYCFRYLLSEDERKMR
jgi:hypothetical protein